MQLEVTSGDTNAKRVYVHLKIGYFWANYRKTVIVIGIQMGLCALRYICLSDLSWNDLS